ncbi:MAG: hypothetical protein N2578_09695 [Bdellovibrionaceae bacterium]|nr:hypothetical protein [Pseudobdellovibrionaceae bacterium]
MYLAGAAAIGLFVLAVPIVELLFMRGHFSQYDAQRTAEVVQVWAFIMVPTSCVRVLAPAYYAVKNTWFPALVSGICLLLHILLAPPLMEGLGLLGLNLSTLVSASLNMALLLLFYRFLIADFAGIKLISSLLRFFLPFAALLPGLLLHSRLLDLWGVEIFGRVMALLCASTLAIFGFVVVSRWLRLEEYEATISRLLRRFRRY